MVKKNENVRYISVTRARKRLIIIYLFIYEDSNNW
jgi:hypothetical protein